MAIQDDDEREEELSSLLAIYPELVIDDNESFSASLDLQIQPAKPFLIRFVPDRHAAETSNGQSYAGVLYNNAAHIEHDLYLTHLPPLHVQIDLPEGYPAQKAPNIKLSADADWLPATRISQLEEEAGKLWSEYGCCQILFSYIDFLQQAAENGFDLGDESNGCLELSTSKEKVLVDFDRATILAKFRQGTYDCEICLEPKKGSACYRMEKCQHVFCLQCLQDFYNNAITEGDVVNVRCLSPGCGKDSKPDEPKSTLHPRELLAMGIDETKVRRYLELKRKKRMESDKTTVYCPRSWCQGPARSPRYPPIPRDLSDYLEIHEVQEGSTPGIPSGKIDVSSLVTDRLAVCEKCALAFCRICYMGWHGSFQRCYPRDPNELSAEEKASYEYIRMNTSPCPTCNSPTQKTMGCNHMRCFQCNTHFCYLCGAWLIPDNPYIHFNTAGSPCYQKLWELEEGDEGPREGDQAFAGPRAYERMAIEVAREADAREAEAAAAVVAANPPAVNDGLDQGRLQRFIDLAARDAEDEWDSDELGDEQDFVIR